MFALSRMKSGGESWGGGETLGMGRGVEVERF